MDEDELLERKRRILAELARIETPNDNSDSQGEAVVPPPPPPPPVLSIEVKEEALTAPTNGCPFKRPASSSEMAECPMKKSRTFDGPMKPELDSDYPSTSDGSTTRNEEHSENTVIFDSEHSKADSQSLPASESISPSEESSPLSTVPSTAFDETKEDGKGNEENDEFVWKTVLETMENDHFDSLPEGWTRITHNSGLPVYLHRETRVVSVSRPYMIPRESVRAHRIPVSAIPCFHQKRINELLKPTPPSDESQQETQDDDSRGSENVNGDVQSMRDVRVEKIEESRLPVEEVTKYASAVFRFKKIKVKRFTNFQQKKYDRQEKRTEETLKSVGLTLDDIDSDQIITTAASGVALINIPTQDMRFNKKSFVMNPTGKSSLTILNEFMQRALKGRVVYDVVETKSIPAPYSCLVLLMMKKTVREQLPTAMKEKLAILEIQGGTPNNKANEDEEQLVVGTGQGISKKSAKLVAAESAVKVLFPAICFDANHIASMKEAISGEQNYDHNAIALFDNMPIDDPRVTDLCVRAGQPKPYVLLKEACNRSIKLQGMKPTRHSELVNEQLTKVTISVGPFSHSVVANGAKVATQRAAQAILKEMHPDLLSFSSILRIYANADEKQNRKENVRQHTEVIRMQNKGPISQPNLVALSKLRAEMHDVTPSQLHRPKSFQLHHD